MSGAVVRPLYGRHPRLSIWGLLEARLQQADLMILGGLNEDTWPARPSADPWLNRSLRRRAGLLLPERQIGLSVQQRQEPILAGARCDVEPAGDGAIGAGQRELRAAVVFDPPGGSFRSEEYKDYKANRTSMDDDLKVQLPYIDKVVEAGRLGRKTTA